MNHSHELSRLYHLDQEQPREGISRLLEYTRLHRLNEIQEDTEEMARTKGSKNKKTVEPAKPSKSTQAAQLIEALAFVSVAGTKSDAPFKAHVMLNAGYAIVCDGQLTAGFPIAEDLECCPHTKLLTTAVSNCGQSLAIIELDNGVLHVKGDNLSANIPCLSFEEMPEASLMRPDANIAVIDDRIKEAFSVCGIIVSENGTNMIDASLLLQANVCTSTNGKVMMQYWHGVDLPPNLKIPKIFASSIIKTKSKLVGFGYNKDVSVTFYFENGGWIKTQLYSDDYPLSTVEQILGNPSNPVEISDKFFKAFEIVAEFQDMKWIYILDNKICSHKEVGIGATYSDIGISANKRLSADIVKLLAPVIKTIDLASNPNLVYFFGDNLRGAFGAIVSDEIPF